MRKDGDSESRANARLYEALCALQTPEEAEALLVDILSARELADLAQRLEVAALLSSGASYLRFALDGGFIHHGEPRVQVPER